MVFPFPLRVYRSDMRCVSGTRHPADNQVIERGNRVGLGPQANLARTIARVPMIEEERAVEIRLDVIPHCHDSDGMPLAERRRLHAPRGQLMPPAVVVI